MIPGPAHSLSEPRVTLSEASELLAVLEPRLPAPSYWQLRDLDVVIGAIDPGRAVVHGTAARGTRLLDSLDLMVLRLWVRIMADTVQPRWIPGAVLSHHRIDLRDVFRRRLDLVLVIRGLRSEIVSPEAAAQLRGERYSLSDIPNGVVDAMRQIRTAKPDVWTGCKRSRVRDVETVPSSSVFVERAC